MQSFHRVAADLCSHFIEQSIDLCIHFIEQPTDLYSHFIEQSIDLCNHFIEQPADLCSHFIEQSTGLDNLSCTFNIHFDISQMIHDDRTHYRSLDQVSYIPSIIDDDKLSRLPDVTCFRMLFDVSESIGIYNRFACSLCSLQSFSFNLLLIYRFNEISGVKVQPSNQRRAYVFIY